MKDFPEYARTVAKTCGVTALVKMTLDVMKWHFDGRHDDIQHKAMSMMTFGITAVSNMALCITTLGITTFSRMTFKTMTLGIMALRITAVGVMTEHNNKM
jgi:hypothetical protein